MFADCRKLTSVPVFDTSNVINMNAMFDGCSSLTFVPAFNTSNVTNMAYMFEDCTSLKSIPEFDASNVTTMTEIFKGCTSLTSILMKGMKCSFDIQDTNFGADKFNLLDDEDKKIATDKGWILKRSNGVEEGGGEIPIIGGGEILL